MRRREFITLLGGAAATWPLGATAQESGRFYRIAALFPNPRGAPQDALFQELARSGFVEGQNLTVAWRSFGQRADLAPEFAADLIKVQPDAILAGGNPAIRAAEQASGTIPIVGITENMVGAGFVNTLEKPGGNTTGVSVFASELDGKRQELLIEALPKLRRIAILADANATSTPHVRALQDAARQRGIETSIHRVGSRPDEIAAALDQAKKSRAEAINVLASPFLYGNRREVMRFAVAFRLPAIYQWPEIAEEGGLIGYGPRIVQLYQGPLARQLVRILRGAKAADVPAERPTQFDLVVNLQAAKAIGIELPASFVSRANKLVE